MSARPGSPPRAVAALCGGVGAARLLLGLREEVDPAVIDAVVNVGDDEVLHGLHVSPDLDTIAYTLSGLVNPDTGWGLAGETWNAMEALDKVGSRRPPGSRAGATWFRLGDRDLATHLYRTGRLAEGATLTEVTAEVSAALGVDVRLRPVTDGRLRTRLVVDGDDLAFQDWFVGRRHQGSVSAVRFDGAAAAPAAPGVVEAVEDAERIVVCPSNPIVSIDPVLAVAQVGDAVRARRDRVVAVSPIIAGSAVKGPAATLLADLGIEPSVVGVARHYAAVASTLVVDTADAASASAVEAEGLRCVVAPTLMVDLDAARRLARVVLEAPVGP